MPSAASDDRPILFVGDVQGCGEELALLLERAGFRAGTHRLLPVGDLVNRGPDSPGVLRLLAETRAEPILGNHELGLLAIGHTGHVPRWAEQPHSAYTQLRAAGQWEAALAEFARWPLWREGPDWIAVHAGLHPRLPPGDTPPDFLTEVRWCDADGARPNPAPKGTLQAPPGFRPWWEFQRGPRTVVFGHWAQRGLVQAPFAWGLDTGCVYGKQLSALWWPEQRLVQVPARRVYRPVSAPPGADFAVDAGRGGA